MKNKISMRFYQYFQPSIVAPVCVNVSHTPINSYNKSKNGLFISLRLSRLLFVLLMIGKLKYQMKYRMLYLCLYRSLFVSFIIVSKKILSSLSITSFYAIFFAREKKNIAYRATLESKKVCVS